MRASIDRRGFLAAMSAALVAPGHAAARVLTASEVSVIVLGA